MTRRHPIGLGENKRIENDLAQNARRLHLALEAGNMGTWEYDIANNRGFCDERLCRLLGYAEHRAFTPEAFFDHIHEEDRPRVLKHVRQAADTGRTFEDQFRVRRTDGRVRWFASRAFVVRDSDGRALSMTGVNYDITQERETKETLRQLVRERTAELAASEAKYRQLVEDTSDIVYAMDARGILRFVGPQAARYGFDPGDLTGRHCLDMVAPADRDRIESELKESLSTGREFPSIFRLNTDDDRTVWLEETGRVQHDDAGRVTGMTGILRDVTERVAREAMIERQRDDLRILTLRLGHAQDEERQRIAADLHDEVAQLLAACQLRLAELESCGDEGERGRLVRTIDDMLNQASDEIRALTFELSSTALFGAGFVPAARELCVHMEAQYGLHCELTCTPDDIVVPPPLRATLYHGLRELLYNAAKHAEAGKTVVHIARVPAEPAPGSREESPDLLRITVHDDGKGFETKELERPLSPQGGFGLYQVRERMHEIGGRLHMESIPADGTQAILEVGVST